MWAPATSTLLIDKQPGEARTARHHVSATLNRWALNSLATTATLLTSEAVTNALTHGENPIALTITLTKRRLRIAVTDGGSATIEMNPSMPTRSAVGGRGLPLICALADAWGTERNPLKGNTVWFEFAIPNNEADGLTGIDTFSPVLSHPAPCPIDSAGPVAGLFADSGDLDCATV